MFPSFSANTRPLSRRGQSMLEAIVALGILVTSISSALTLVTKSISAEKESETAIVATNLGREGIEAARAIRDSNWLAGLPWDTGMYLNATNDYSGIPVFAPATAGWSFDFTPNAIDEDAARVYRYTTGSGAAVPGLFVQAAAQPASAQTTLFRRLMFLDPLCATGPGAYDVVTDGAVCPAGTKIGIRVTSRVSWNSGGRVKTLDLEERLFDWR